jgi:menaquinone-dependent protoporphyrinogen oxidase
MIVTTVLVVYASSSGCTRAIAETMADRLRMHVSVVEVSSVDDEPDPSRFDAVIVGSGVRVGQWRKSARIWTASNAAALRDGPVAFYTVGLILSMFPDRIEEVRAYTDPLIAQTDVHPVDVGLFTGWNQPDTFGRAERLMIKAMKAPVGDFRDWDAVRRWTDRTAASFGLAA